MYNKKTGPQGSSGRHQQSPVPTGIALALAAAFWLPAPAQAADVELPRIDVIGEGQEAIAKQPGSVAIVDKETIALVQPISTQDALKAVPGIVVREEEGYGFIPNIGMRGLNPNRSQKLLVLEDGVPVAPGLFLANESYYSPRIERMETIEVLKGAAALRYGPTTIGGVINYKTKVPEDGVKITAKGGSHGYRLLGLDAGGKSPSGEAMGGISVVKARGDGFRDNGFDMTDIVVKGGMAIGSNQWVGVKFTHYDNEVNTSYVGLRPNEYRADPTKNPAPDDYFLTERKSFDINHELMINDQARVSTLIYWSQLDRDYWRRDIASRTADGTTFRACGGTANCMTGRNRTFEMAGIDSRLHLDYKAFGIANEAEVGVRLHSDSLSNKTVSSRTNPNARSGTLTSDETQEAQGVALYVQNRFVLTSALAITPGVRVETYDQKRENELTGVKGDSQNTEVMPGLGFTWQIVPAAQLFGGAYKAFSPAMVATAISAGGVDQELDAERSTNFEIGVRGRMSEFSYEATVFRMAFDNQVVNQTLSGGIDKANGGETLHQGVELALGYEIGQGWGIDTNATYLPIAKFIGSDLGPSGNRLPYAPKLTANAALTYKAGAVKASLGANHVSDQYTDPANSRAQNTTGTAGRISGYTVYNLGVNYAISKQLTAFGTVRNLADRKYIASRHPDGIFPGAERNFELGASYKF